MGQRARGRAHLELEVVDDHLLALARLLEVRDEARRVGRVVAVELLRARDLGPVVGNLDADGHLELSTRRVSSVQRS